MSALRRWYWKRIRRHGGETCESCGCAYWAVIGKTWWTVPDELWLAVVGSARGLRCPACFTREAWAKGIHVHYVGVRDK